MQLTRSEIDELLRCADEAVTRLRRATLELRALGEQLLAVRDAPDAARPR